MGFSSRRFYLGRLDREFLLFSFEEGAKGGPPGRGRNRDRRQGVAEYGVGRAAMTRRELKNWLVVGIGDVFPVGMGGAGLD